jgi:hypothetical protein
MELTEPIRFTSHTVAIAEFGRAPESGTFERAEAAGRFAQMLPPTIPTASDAAQAFEELDRARSDTTGHEEVLDEFARTSNYPERLEVVSKLQRLLAAFQEERGGAAYSFESLQLFLAFMALGPRCRVPSLSITGDGNIYASWRAGPDRLFSVHFDPAGRIRYVKFYPDPNTVGMTARSYGFASLREIVATLPPWVTE